MATSSIPHNLNPAGAGTGLLPAREATGTPAHRVILVTTDMRVSKASQRALEEARTQASCWRKCLRYFSCCCILCRDLATLPVLIDKLETELLLDGVPIEEIIRN